MSIINKTLEPNVKEMLLSLEIRTQAVVLPEHRKRYLRLVIGKIQRENPKMKYKTEVKNEHIYAYRLR